MTTPGDEPDHDRGAAHRGLLRRHRVLSAGLVVVLLLTGFWGLRLWQLRREVDRYRRYWSEAHGEPGGLLYVALGDSRAPSMGGEGSLIP